MVVKTAAGPTDFGYMAQRSTPVGGDVKSDVRRLLELWERVAKDAASKCYTACVADWPLDVARATKRVEHEGLSFLTITLPAFGAEFEKALASGLVDSTCFAGWQKRGCLPVFLQGFTSLVFERTGHLKEEPDVAAIEGIRQLAYVFKKILLPCTTEREQKAIDSYLEIEHELTSKAFDYDSSDLFDSVARMLWGDVFGGDVDYRTLIPKHGPGATCEHITNNKKYAHRTWYDRLQPYFPFDETAYPSTILGTAELGKTEFISGGNELPVRVTLVPKTLKTPRIIAIEPVCMQYTQQALARYLITNIERHWITSGHINFKDQGVNQRLAIDASMSGELATLDLSSASDRVPLSGVERMLKVNQDLIDGLLATRSTRAEMPDGSTIQLGKFASMGSATCFPVEAMYFFTVIITALIEYSSCPVTLRNIKDLSRNVYVYGDDLIVPVDAVEVILQTLAKYNCKVGLSKSFWFGKFRESCGVEAYNGEVVTPTYLRRMAPKSQQDANSVISWIETSNQFYLRGYWAVADYMKTCVESVTGKLPLVLEKAGGLGWRNFQGGYSVHRWNSGLQRFEVKTFVPAPRFKKDKLSGSSALMKYFLSCKELPDSLKPHYDDLKSLDSNFILEQIAVGQSSIRVARGEKVRQGAVARFRSKKDVEDRKKLDHLHRSVRRGDVSIKSRWVSPY